MTITLEDIKAELRKELKDHEEYRRCKDFIEKYQEVYGTRGPHEAMRLWCELVEQLKEEIKNDTSPN